MRILGGVVRVGGRILMLVAVVAGLGVAQLPGVDAAPPTPLVVGTERPVTRARPGSFQSDASAGFTNGVFFVVWAESAPGLPSQIYGTRVKPDGTILDPNGILLSPPITPENSLNNNLLPRVAGGAGSFIVVWQIDIEGTYSDLGAAMVTSGGVVKKQWSLSNVDNGQYAPEIAWNGRLFLATWQDEPDPGDEDIYGARITPAGLILDGCNGDTCPNGDLPGIPIATTVGNQLRPAITGTTDQFIVAWTDATDPAHPTVRTNAVPINAFVPDTSGYPVTQGPTAQSEPAVGWVGSTALYAWNDAGSSSNIRAMTTQPGDESSFFPEPQQPNGFTISAAAGDQTGPVIARRSGHFVVAWTDLRSGNADVFAARVGVAGAVLDGAGVGLAAGPRQQRNPALATSGPKILVAYQRDTPAAPFNGVDRVYVRVVS